MNGYIEAMQDANLPISDSTIIHSGIFIRDGEQTMEDILSETVKNQMLYLHLTILLLSER